MQRKYSFKTILAGFAMSVAVAICTLSLTSCGDDNDEPSVVPQPSAFTGTFTTTVPSMASFTPVECTNTITVEWLDPSSTHANVTVGAFVIETGMPGHDYTIGQMNINDVECTRQSDGTIVLSKADFECMAGDFDTTGSFSATISADNMTATITYRPGSMPFDVQSTFTGSK